MLMHKVSAALVAATMTLAVAVVATSSGEWLVASAQAGSTATGLD